MADNEMTAEIRAIIEKNLPSQVGETLKKVIDQGRMDAETLKTIRTTLELRTKDNASLQERINEYKKRDDDCIKILEREGEVAQGERNQKVFESELKLKEAEKRINEITNFVGMAFKSPVYRKSVDDIGSWHTHYDNNGVPHNVKDNGEIVETSTVE